MYGQAAFRDKAMQYHPSKSINKSPKNQGISVQPACITSCFCMWTVTGWFIASRGILTRCTTHHWSASSFFSLWADAEVDVDLDGFQLQVLKSSNRSGMLIRTFKTSEAGETSWVWNFPERWWWASGDYVPSTYHAKKWQSTVRPSDICIHVCGLWNNHKNSDMIQFPV